MRGASTVPDDCFGSELKETSRLSEVSGLEPLHTIRRRGIGEFREIPGILVSFGLEITQLVKIAVSAGKVAGF